MADAAVVAGVVRDSATLRSWGFGSVREQADGWPRSLPSLLECRRAGSVKESASWQGGRA